MALNKHGLKLVGIKKAAGFMNRDLFGDWYNMHYDIMYNRETGEVWVDYVGENTAINYRSSEQIFRVLSTKHAMNMQQITNAIYERLLNYDWMMSH